MTGPKWMAQRAIRVPLLLLSVFLGLPPTAVAATIDFDAFPGMSFLGGSVPASSQLFDQLQPTTGAIFSSLGGANYVAVADLETGSPSAHAPSPPNGIGGVTSTGFIGFGVPIKISFFDPVSETTPAVTDFVSVTGDLRPIAGDIILKAFDISGLLIGMDQQPDSPGGRVVSFGAPGIHFVTLESTSGTVAFDNLVFNDVTPVPLPASILFLVSALIVVVRLARPRLMG